MLFNHVAFGMASAFLYISKIYLFFSHPDLIWKFQETPDIYMCSKRTSVLRDTAVPRQELMLHGALCYLVMVGNWL